jgi:hypothetical protein
MCAWRDFAEGGGSFLSKLLPAVSALRMCTTRADLEQDPRCHEYNFTNHRSTNFSIFCVVICMIFKKGFRNSTNLSGS